MADKKKKEKESVKVKAIWEKSTKRMERYRVEENSAGVSGTLYVPKDKARPENISITFQEEE